LTRLNFDENLILPEFAVLLFNSRLGRKYFSSANQGSVIMVKVSQVYMAGFMVPYIGNIPKQLLIVAAMNAQGELINSLMCLKQQATQQITEKVKQIWENR
jgi:hypothetical protein